MLKQIYFDDMTGKEIPGDVYQLIVTAVRGPEAEYLTKDMHFTLETINKIIEMVGNEDWRRKEVEDLEEQVKLLGQENNNLKEHVMILKEANEKLGNRILKLEADGEDDPEKIVYKKPEVISSPVIPDEPVPFSPEEDLPEDKEDSIKGIDEGKLKALYEAGWTVKDIADDLKRTQKAISQKLYLMKKKGQIQ